MRKGDDSMTKTYSSLDVYLSTFIYLYTNIYPELINHNGKVSFHFPLNEKVISAISDYDSGMEVIANRFASTIKHFKAQIFQVKNNEKSEECK